MSDTGRKGVGEQGKEKVTPQNQKVRISWKLRSLTWQSYTQQTSEALSGTYDRVAAAIVPDENKSTTQSASESLRGGTDSASAQGKRCVDKAKDTTDNVLGNKQAGTGRSNV